MIKISNQMDFSGATTSKNYREHLDVLTENRRTMVGVKPEVDVLSEVVFFVCVCVLFKRICPQIGKSLEPI